MFAAGGYRRVRRIPRPHDPRSSVRCAGQPYPRGLNARSGHDVSCNSRFGAGEGVAVHDAAECLPKFGLRLQLPELAFLGGEAVRVGCGFIGLGFLGDCRAPFGLSTVLRLPRSSRRFSSAGVSRIKAIDFGTDFRRPDL